MRWLMVLALAFIGCAETRQDDLEPATTPASTVQTREETAGIVTGSVDGEAVATQRIAASQKARAKDVYVEFPVGSLTSDTQVTIQDGDQELGAVGALPTDLGIAATITIAFAASPVLLAAESGVEPEAPFQLSMPLPLDAGASLTDGALALAADGGRLALLYLLKSSAGNTIGLQVLTSADLIGAMLRVQPRRFGWFRIVLLSGKTQSVTDKATLREPEAGA